ncbi:protein P21-like [Lolium rigidum]|uniref:protein P21-like n=1 Tax=Lolium rigidum TaxID=89674 RepID=UPI001F5D1762|nr:protein P21-like [Lolium rigidum]
MASSLSIILAVLLTVASTDAATITVLNKCSYTVWPAAFPVGGGTKLDPGKSWSFQAPAGTQSGRIWARTGCSFDGSGAGSCTTGDCGGVLACAAPGKPPASLAAYTLGTGSVSDFYDISLVDGFNVPMSFAPTHGSCRTVTCSADINSQCPPELKVDGGCLSACLKFNTPQYCCPLPSSPARCPPTDYSRFFKRLCPDAYSYAFDGKSTIFSCASGTDYRVTFCP